MTTQARRLHSTCCMQILTSILLFIQCERGRKLYTSVKSSDIWPEYLCWNQGEIKRKCHRCLPTGSVTKPCVGMTTRGEDRITELSCFARILWLDFPIKPIHLVHCHALVVSCKKVTTVSVRACETDQPMTWTSEGATSHIKRENFDGRHWLTSRHVEVVRIQQLEAKQGEYALHWKRTSIHEVTIEKLRSGQEESQPGTTFGLWIVNLWSSFHCQCLNRDGTKMHKFCVSRPSQTQIGFHYFPQIWSINFIRIRMDFLRMEDRWAQICSWGRKTVREYPRTRWTSFPEAKQSWCMYLRVSICQAARQSDTHFRHCYVDQRRQLHEDFSDVRQDLKCSTTCGLSSEKQKHTAPSILKENYTWYAYFLWSFFCSLYASIKSFMNFRVTLLSSSMGPG